MISEWKTPLQNIGSKQNNQNLQRSHAVSYFTRAENLANQFDVITTQGLAFLFDQSVQEWSFSSSDSTVASDVNYYASEYFKIHKERMPDVERLAIILDYVRTTDGKNRRTAIKDGSGTVHGKSYDIDNFNLSYSQTF